MGGDGERRTVRLGNTWLMLPYAGVIVAVAVTFDWMSVAALTDRRATAPTGALALLVLTAATLTCVVVAMAAFAVRLPDSSCAPSL
jgi:hypothetical protein